MHVGIDIRPLGTASGRRGVGTYIRGLLGGLGEELSGGREKVSLFRHRSDAPDPAHADYAALSLTRPRRAITLWDQLAWPLLLARHHIDVFHSTFYTLPVLGPRNCGRVQTIYDLSPLKVPGAVTRRNALIFRLNFALARMAERIIVPSESTRTDVVELLGIQPARIVLTPLATDFSPDEIARAHSDFPSVIARFCPDRSYFLHTGGHDSVKNIPTLIEAFGMLAKRERNLSILILGEHSALTRQLAERAHAWGLQDKVLFPGFVSRSDLLALYCGAVALVYPSLAEGFGLPVLEAMACGAPVIAARAGAIPEVGGDACLYVDPSNAEEIAGSMERILGDSVLAAALAERGRSRAGQFSWRDTARRTLEAYREVAG